MGCPVKFRSSGVVTPKDALSTYGDTVSLGRLRLRRLRKIKRRMPRARSNAQDTTPPIIAPRLEWFLQQGQLMKPDKWCVSAPRIRRRDFGSGSSGNFRH